MIARPSFETLTLIQLNLWYGRLFYPLKKFIATEKPDLLSVQELLSCAIDQSPTYMTAENLTVIGDFMPPSLGGPMPWITLRGHDMPAYTGIFNATHLNCVAQKTITAPVEVKDKGDVGDYPNSLVHVQLQTQNGQALHMLTCHSPVSRSRGPNGERLGNPAAERLFVFYAAYIASLKGAVIFSGDFNLDKEAAFLQPLQKIGLENLNERFGITKARNAFAWKADESVCHIFINNAIKVIDYDVLPDLVSDHAPLRLRFQVVDYI